MPEVKIPETNITNSDDDKELYDHTGALRPEYFPPKEEVKPVKPETDEPVQEIKGEKEPEGKNVKTGTVTEIIANREEEKGNLAEHISGIVENLRRKLHR